MRRHRLDLFDLTIAAHGVWRGHRCVHDGKRYREYPVVVTDLETLPVRARVYLEGQRWVRP
jgi:hypothetical protein